MKILHVFYSTLPNAKGGDIRSRDLIEAQREVGLDVVAVSSPFQPPAAPGATIEVIDGTSYYRCHDAAKRLIVLEQDQGIAIKIQKAMKLISFSNRVYRIGGIEKPDAIHAHSMFFCAFAGWYAAKRLRVPLVYEVRSLWEERSFIRAPSLKTRTFAGLFRILETCAMRAADHVVVISLGLQRDIKARGISGDDITVVGNGVNLARFSKSAVQMKPKTGASLVFAYVGSISEIEGLDLLVAAVKKLRAKGWKNQVKFYGDGPGLIDLKRLAEGVEDVSFLGPFDPREAQVIYESIDVIVNPRRSSMLTEKVTPLKPLEAMAWGKLVVASSVGGMLELVSDGKTGFVFEADDVDALVRTLEHVVDFPENIPEIAERAQQFVVRDRSWRTNGLKYKALYEELVPTFRK